MSPILNSSSKSTGFFYHKEEVLKGLGFSSNKWIIYMSSEGVSMLWLSELFNITWKFASMMTSKQKSDKNCALGACTWLFTNFLIFLRRRCISFIPDIDKKKREPRIAIKGWKHFDRRKIFPDAKRGKTFKAFGSNGWPLDLPSSSVRRNLVTDESKV